MAHGTWRAKAVWRMQREARDAFLKDGAKQQNALRWTVHSHTHQHMFHSVCAGWTIDKTFRPIKSVLQLIVDLLLDRR